MWSDDSDEADIPQEPPYRYSLEEIRAAAEIVVYLELELGLDPRRLSVSVREGTVYIQGSVSSPELRQEIERYIPTRPGVKGLESSLTVREDEDDWI